MGKDPLPACEGNEGEESRGNRLVVELAEQAEAAHAYWERTKRLYFRAAVESGPFPKPEH
jgi:hypothetical protein